MSDQEERQRVYELPSWFPRSKRAATFAVISIILGGMIPAMGASILLISHFSNENTALTRNLFTEVCNRNNVAKALDRVNVSRSSKFFATPLSARAPVPGLRRRAIETTDALNVLLNCEATFSSATGKSVLLVPKVERVYLRHISEGNVPELKDGRIVGKHRAETQGHKDF